MSKDEFIDSLLKDPSNWITRKCCICEEPEKMNKILDSRADLNNPYTCIKCLNKE